MRSDRPPNGLVIKDKDPKEAVKDEGEKEGRSVWLSASRPACWNVLRQHKLLHRAGALSRKAAQAALRYCCRRMYVLHPPRGERTCVNLCKCFAFVASSLLLEHHTQSSSSFAVFNCSFSYLGHCDGVIGPRRSLPVFDNPTPFHVHALQSSCG